MLHEPALVAVGHVPMPVPDGDVRLGAQIAQAEELVVDERLQRTDVDAAHGGRRILIEQGDNGEEGRLRLAGGGGGRQQHVVVGMKDGLARGHLDGPQIFPAAAVDILLNKGGVAVEDAHRLLLV